MVEAENRFNAIFAEHKHRKNITFRQKYFHEIIHLCYEKYNYGNEIRARAMVVTTNIADFWIINTSLFLAHANNGDYFFTEIKCTFVLTLVDMTGRIGDHNLRFGRGRGKLTGKLDIRILRAVEEQILPQIRQFLDPLCPPCHSNFGTRL